MFIYVYACIDAYKRHHCIPPPVCHPARPCLSGWLFLFPSTGAALASCRVSERAGGWCAPSRASGLVWPRCHFLGCWWTASGGCCLMQTEEMAVYWTSRIYLKTQQWYYCPQIGNVCRKICVHTKKNRFFTMHFTSKIHYRSFKCVSASHKNIILGIRWH